MPHYYLQRDFLTREPHTWWAVYQDPTENGILSVICVQRGLSGNCSINHYGRRKCSPNNSERISRREFQLALVKAEQYIANLARLHLTEKQHD